MVEHADILVAGGGPVGATAALALREGGFDLAILEARETAQPARDPRALALSYASRLILERLDVWRRMPEPTPITRIHVSQRGRLGHTWLSSQEMGLPALGYVVEYGALDGALQAALRAVGITVVHGARVHRTASAGAYAMAEFETRGAMHTATARLLVIADGGRGLAEDSRSEEKAYGQSAVVCAVRTDRPHDNIAYERFTPEGPMALLPLGGGYALVWTTPADEVDSRLALDDKDFLADLQNGFGDRAGRFTAATRRAAFPLRLARREPVPGPHQVRIGNAAQILHPVAGQGFNLGLRDAWSLSRLALSTPASRLGHAEMLEAHVAARSGDTANGILMTDLLVNTFSNDFPPLAHARGAALAMLDIVAPARRWFARRMIFGAGG
jgi:2-octaprenyl-6-methoxyphenol hydroxylase